MNTRKLVLGITLTAFSLAIPSSALLGQSMWRPQTSGKSMGMEISKPFFDGGQMSALSTTTLLWVQWPIRDKVQFVGELPLAYGSYDDEFGGESDFVLGNPYLGLRIGEDGSNLSGQLGVRLPLTPSHNNLALGVGLFSDFISRPGAFWPDNVPITGTVAYQVRKDDGLIFRVVGGADAWIATESDYGDRVEAWGLYGAGAGYENEVWSFSGTLAGRAILTESGGSLADRTVHELGLDIGYLKASVQPNLFVRFPLDEGLRENLNVVVGFGIRTRL
jgi:hypothetical protein